MVIDTTLHTFIIFGEMMRTMIELSLLAHFIIKHNNGIVYWFIVVNLFFLLGHLTESWCFCLMFLEVREHEINLVLFSADSYWFFLKFIIIYSITMRLLILLLLLFALTQAQHEDIWDYKALCLAYQSRKCVTCPFNYNILNNECFQNITGCLEYKINQTGLSECTKCNSSIAAQDGMGGCRLTVPISRIIFAM